MLQLCSVFFFFFNDTATTEIYTLSLHDALPIFAGLERGVRPIGLWSMSMTRSICSRPSMRSQGAASTRAPFRRDRKSTRLNSSHDQISYAVFCLKKKNIHNNYASHRDTTCIITG